MRVKTLFTPIMRLIFFALVTSSLTTLTAFDFYPHAFESTSQCDPQAVTRWQVKVADGDAFGDAEILLAETERFLRVCPRRPEVPIAQALAGVLSNRVGDPKRALFHFEAAAPLQQTHAVFAQISSLLAVGDSDAAWALRDQTVDAWLRRLAPRATIREDDVGPGRIIQVTLTHMDQNTGIKEFWLAVPQGPGWPATVSAGPTRQLPAIRLIANTDTEERHYVDFYRCRSRRILGGAALSVNAARLTEQAKTLLNAYLLSPDQHAPSEAGEPLKSCFWPDRLLPQFS